MTAELLEIVSLSLTVSGIALLFSTVVGIPLGVMMGLTRFPGRKLVIALLYTGMGFPPVVIGLFVYLLLSRSGPLGSLNWTWLPSLFTPSAMILATYDNLTSCMYRHCKWPVICRWCNKTVIN